MALLQVKNYFKQIEKQYLDMRALVKEYDEALKKGEVDPEQAEESRKLLFRLEDNYKRWAYLMYLLNTPAKSAKEKKHNKQHNSVKEYLEPYSAKTALADDEYVLKEFEKKVKELKK